MKILVCREFKVLKWLLASSSASVRQQTTGAAYAPRPLVLLSCGVPPQGPALARSEARSVAPGRYIFAISNFGQLLANEAKPIFEFETDLEKIWPP